MDPNINLRCWRDNYLLLSNLLSTTFTGSDTLGAHMPSPNRILLLQYISHNFISRLSDWGFHYLGIHLWGNIKKEMEVCVAIVVMYFFWNKLMGMPTNIANLRLGQGWVINFPKRPYEKLGLSQRAAGVRWTQFCSILLLLLFFLNLFIGLLVLPSIMVPVPHVAPWEY